VVVELDHTEGTPRRGRGVELAGVHVGEMAADHRRGYARALVKMSAMLSFVLMGWMSMIAVSTSSRSLNSLTAWCL
jgi:hypothetical protein